VGETSLKLRELESRATKLEAIREERLQQQRELEAELTKLTTDLDLTTKAEATLLHISTKILGQSTKTIDNLVTAGLHLTFEDQKLEFRTTTEKMRGKTAIRFHLLDNGRTAPLMDAYGGGVLVIVGVLLRVVTITALGLKRILFLDETLSHLSEQYVDNASRLLRKLCDELDFTIVMVTHQPEFAAHAHVRYRVEGKNGTAIFTRDNSAKTAG